MAYKRTEKSAHIARRHQERLERPLKDLRAEVEEAEKRYNGSGEAEVVMAKQIAEILEEWAERWMRERNHEIERDGWSDQSMTVMGPWDWLKEMTGLHIRRIYGIRQGEFKYVSLTQAELLLQVIDREYLLSNGTVRVIPNPNWTPEKWLDYMKERGCL